MNFNMLDTVVKIASCVCGKDGIISAAEEETMYEIVHAAYPNYSYDRFNQALDDFFADELQIESYAGQITSNELQSFTIKLCEASASADGLEVQENIALQKVILIFGGAL